VREPDNHTAWVDSAGDTWVRVDEVDGRYGNWWPLTDGPGWESWAQGGVGGSRTWDLVEAYGPFTEADSDRTARALARVRRELDR
jgi:hypothetical protein